MAESAVYDIEKLVARLLEERKAKYNKGIYHYTQVSMAYNSNRIEGSRLTHDQTLSLFETKTLIQNGDEPIHSDDITETTNHFRAFDFILDKYDEVLSEPMIKKIHFILKNNTSDSFLDWFNVGEYKSQANMVGDSFTTMPEEVPDKMAQLLIWYQGKKKITINEVIEFHWRLEKIHPFQDGNGRVGRLILFKECLKHGIVPFIIDAEHKLYYYRGLKEFSQEKGFLTDTCLSAQDRYTAYCKHLVPKFVVSQ